VAYPGIPDGFPQEIFNFLMTRDIPEKKHYGCGFKMNVIGDKGNYKKYFFYL
jgi:hypothetical protein